MKEKQTKPQNLDGLIYYLQQEKGIQISGAEQIQKFRNMGYYHGYKGYRYIGNARQQEKLIKHQKNARKQMIPVECYRNG